MGSFPEATIDPEALIGGYINTTSNKFNINSLGEVRHYDNGFSYSSTMQCHLRNAISFLGLVVSSSAREKRGLTASSIF